MHGGDGGRGALGDPVPLARGGRWPATGEAGAERDGDGAGTQVGWHVLDLQAAGRHEVDARQGRQHCAHVLGAERPAGNSLTSVAPALRAAMISVGVSAPGSSSSPRARAVRTTPATRPGETTKRAPASAAACTCASVVTVPTPTGRPWRRASATASSAPGVSSRDLGEPDAAGGQRGQRAVHVAAVAVAHDGHEPLRAHDSITLRASASTPAVKRISQGASTGRPERRSDRCGSGLAPD